MCLNSIIAPFYFVTFILLTQFVLFNVLVAVLMKYLEVSVTFKTINYKKIFTLLK